MHHKIFYLFLFCINLHQIREKETCVMLYADI